MIKEIAEGKYECDVCGTIITSQTIPEKCSACEKEQFGEENYFIWNEEEVLKTKYFPMDVINDKLSFGFLMPKIVSDEEGKRQINRPTLVVSEDNLVVVNKRFKEDNNIDFRSIPYTLPRRWKLEDMKKYVDGEVEPVDKLELLNKIIDIYKTYLYIRDETWYKVHALWDIGTYLHMGFSAYPFIELRGLAGTGKTKSMVISSMISFNGCEIMVNPSESTLFREKEDVRGTTYFDEAEKLWVFNKATKQYEGDTRTELINSSYTKAAKVPRQEKIGNKFVTKWYSPYGPTQLGSINGLYGATETRAITRITTKSPNKDARGEREPEDDRNDSIWAEIRDNCYRFALDNFKSIMEVYQNFPKDNGLKRRDLQLWRPLLSIAKYISEELYLEVLNFAIAISERNLDDLVPESSFDYAVLKALKSCLEDIRNSDKVYIQDIKSRYCILEHKQEGLEDKYLNRNISNHLDKLGFKELRNRDNKASYFDINLSTFNEIVGPIVPNLVSLSPLSTLSTPLHIKDNKNSGDGKVMSVDDKNKKVVMVAISGESVDDRDMTTSKFTPEEIASTGLNPEDLEGLL